VVWAIETHTGSDRLGLHATRLIPTPLDPRRVTIAVVELSCCYLLVPRSDRTYRRGEEATRREEGQGQGSLISLPPSLSLPLGGGGGELLLTVAWINLFEAMNVWD